MRLPSLLAAFVLPVLLVAAPVPKEKEKVKDDDAILGTWKIEKFDLGGGPGAPPQQEIDKMRFVFEKDSVMRVTRGTDEDAKGTFKLDPTAKVKTLDLIINPPGGGAKPETMLGLYELDGDTLKLCVTKGPNQNRPAEIKADGKDTAVITFTRVKDEKKDK
jgi:uncharacterized protein (TIGR03067 family)